MRVALVNPPDGNEEGRVLAEVAMPPFGIASIAAVLRADGVDTDLYDLACEWPIPMDRLEEVGFFQHDVFGFTSYTNTFAAALTMVDAVRARRPDAIIVFGGPHAGPSPERILRRHLQIDAVISRDGEMPMRDLLRCLRSGTPDLEAVPQFAYRATGLRGPHQSDAKISVNATLAEAVPRDELPWVARDFIIEPSRYIEEAKDRPAPVRVEFMLGSTGCPKRCTFCSIIVMQPNYRSRSAESLVAEAEWLYAQSPFGHIRFVDANFFAFPSRTLEFSRLLHAWHPEITWSSTATADTIVRNRDTVLEVGSLNCQSVEIGIESGSDPVLLRFGKGPAVTDNEAAIEILAEAGIELELDFIMFDPLATAADIRNNISFLNRNALASTFPAHHIYNRLRLYPGTTDMEAFLLRSPAVDDDMLDDVIVPDLEQPSIAAVYQAIERFRMQYGARLAAHATALDIIYRAALDEQHGDGSALPVGAIAAAALGIRIRHVPQSVLGALVDLLEDQAANPDIEQAIATAVDLAGLDEALVQAGKLIAGSVDVADQIAAAFSQIGAAQSFTEDGVVYVLPPSGDMIALNASASFVWQRLAAENANLATATEAYAERFGVTLKEAEEDVRIVIDEILGHDETGVVHAG